MGTDLPAGTTFPRGFANAESIRFPLVPARDLFELKYGKALVATDRRPGRIPVYGTNGRCGSHDQALFAGPGVILGRKGQGPLGVEWCDTDFWVIDTAYSLIPQRRDVDLKYSYYLIKYIGLNHLKDGTSNPSLSRDTFLAQTLPLPPLPQQRAIAHILSTLDDKIELNRRMNETLEAMAWALFKSWFVDFDPVRAKMEGRWRPGQSLPDLPAHLYDLFPDKLVPSELGEIPEGWEVMPLDAIADFQNGLALQKYRPGENEERLPVVKIAQLRSGQADSGEWAAASIRPECIIDDGDVVFSWSGSLMVKLWCGGRAALNQHLFKVTSEQSPKWFYLHCTRSHLPEFQRIASGKATTMGHIKRHHLSEAKCVVPSSTLLFAADERFAVLLAKRTSANIEARTLAVLRDTLLPKLISGELRVTDAERIVERTC